MGVGKEERGRKREGGREGEEGEEVGGSYTHHTRTMIVVTWWPIQQASLGRSDSDSLEEFRVHQGELNHLSRCEVRMCVCVYVWMKNV